MKIAVVGIGYVGLAQATLLSVNNEVVVVDIVKEKVDKVNKRISPIKDNYIEKYFREQQLNLKATLDYEEAFTGADFIIISTPTNYNEQEHIFDTSSITDTIEKIKSINCDATIVIKSTVPIGFTKKIKEKYHIDKMFFSPEFLREGMALYDNLYPSRIIIGGKSKEAEQFATLLKEASLKKSVDVVYMDNIEAEAVKLFSNAYLSLRVAYFNEMDTYAIAKGLNSKEIIEGVCKDARIGDFYNNPSFGYGGYCLPKDTKQLLEEYMDIPQNLIRAIVESNNTRKNFIVDEILKMEPKVVGIYRLTMKKGSDNFRCSAVYDIIRKIKENGIKIILYEPILESALFNGYEVEKDIRKFKDESSIILANRVDNVLEDVLYKTYTRDILGKDF